MHPEHLQHLEQMIAVSNEVSELLGDEPHSVNVVIPNAKADRVPYIEVRYVPRPFADEHRRKKN